MGRREASFPLAGFLVSPIGRFWVSPEDIVSVARRLTAASLANGSRDEQRLSVQ
jgi:hypothetical protein